ncbi:MAG: sterol desaturase family protein [Bacteroidetes bacterium]|nr:sterol desaturase family protein [Bacteroidota bacterium]
MENLIKIIGKAFAITLVRYFLIAGFAFLVFYVIRGARFKKSKIQARAASAADFFREIRHSGLSSLVLSAEACLVLFTPLRQHTLLYRHLSDYPLWWLPVSVAFGLLIHDAYFYWMHRLLHHPLLFKHTHLVHHLSVNPSPWASYSFHFLEAAAEGLIVIILAFILPLHELGIILFTISSFVINVYGHLGYEIMPKTLRKSFWFKIINTSVYHNLHHSRFKGNYGLYFRHWDRWMGTENPQYEKEYDKVQERRFGGYPSGQKKEAR